ncbi:MAG TPA: aminoglycoside phosphotransferase family protein [Acidimicrobiales bacterium]|nr:aminoglycoside phosphotransferase family protein [Acidimicrobiales bacterium]
MNSDQNHHAPLPAAVEEITPAWLSDVLAADVTGVTSSPVGEVAGFVGVVSRLHLEHGGGVPDTLVAKLTSPNEQARQYVSYYGLYRSEHHFYTEIAERVPVRVPRCHYADLGDDASSVVLLLEDLTSLRLGDQVAGGSPADAERLVRAAARLHASWWNAPELDGLDWLPRADADLNKARQDHAAANWEVFVDRYGDVLTPSARAAGELAKTKLADLLDSWWQRGPRTYVHFDVRLDNVFFDDAVATGGDGVALIDWQMSIRGLGASDLAWFSWSLTPEVRRALWDTLLDAYLHELTAHGVTGYTRGDLDRDVRECLVLTMAMTVLGGATAPTPDARSKAVIDTLVERVSLAVTDLDVASAV